MSDKTTPSTKSPKVSIWDVYYPRNVDAPAESVPVASFPMIIYFWPTVLIFLGGGLLQLAGWASPTLVGALATVILALNLLVIVTDLDQKRFLIVLLLLLVFGLLVYIANKNEWGFVSAVFGWLGGLELTYGTDTLLTLGVLLAIFFAVGMANPRLDYWLLEANEFVHYVQPWGRDQSFPRQGSTVAREIPDILELILTFGGGTLVIKREEQVVARIEHVPFLSRRMRAIDRLLSSTRVTIAG